MRKEFFLLILLLVMFVTPLYANAAIPGREGIHPLEGLDVWIDPASYQAYYYTGLNEGDRLHGEFEVTYGTGIDFFICDSSTYHDWDDGYQVSVSYFRNNVGSHSYSFTVPYGGTWYLVFRNQNWLLSYHVEGDMYLTRASANTSSAVTGVIVLLSIIILVGVCAKAASDQAKVKSAVSPPSFDYQQPYQPVPTKSATLDAFCKYCGARRPPGARFCSKCGGAFDGPEIS